MSTALKFRACLAGLDKCRAPKPLPFLIPTSPELLQPYGFLLAPHNSLLLRLRSTPLSSTLPSSHRENVRPQNSPLWQSSARAFYIPPRSAIAKGQFVVELNTFRRQSAGATPARAARAPSHITINNDDDERLLASLMSPPHSASKQAENPHDA